MRIGIDLLGSDASPVELFDGVLRVAEQAFPGLVLVAFIDQGQHKRLCPSFLSKKIEFVTDCESVTMADDPLRALKRKRSSLALGMRMLKEKHIDAFVSTGNTGALIAHAAFTLPRLPHCKRPALLAVLPTLQGPLTVVDIGGNVSYRPEHLVQFARLGSAYHRSCYGASVARVGLLNIGVESKKGSQRLQEAYHLLHDFPESGIAFIGNIEARDVFCGSIDVLVTDGFTGNVLLKTSEGISRFIFEYLEKQEASLSMPPIFDYGRYPGAVVCGVDGLVIKCHGQASSASLYCAIQEAVKLLRQGFISKMKLALQ